MTPASIQHKYHMELLYHDTCIVELAPTFSKHPMLGQVLATEGGNATISCDPEAAPKAEITWLKDGNVSIDCVSW